MGLFENFDDSIPNRKIFPMFKGEETQFQDTNEHKNRINDLNTRIPDTNNAAAEAELELENLSENEIDKMVQLICSDSSMVTQMVNAAFDSLNPSAILLLIEVFHRICYHQKPEGVTVYDNQEQIYLCACFSTICLAFHCGISRNLCLKKLERFKTVLFADEYAFNNFFHKYAIDIELKIAKELGQKSILD